MATTASAVSGVPSLNSTPSRSVNVQRRPSSATAQDVARAGAGRSLSSTVTSGSHTRNVWWV
nr:hypothetical protein [Nonomuraea deserti]